MKPAPGGAARPRPPSLSFPGIRVFGPVRVRLGLIVLIAGIPLLILGSVLTAQTYNLAIIADASETGRILARDQVFLRLTEVALLIILGLASVAWGVHRFLTKPMGQLSAAVRGWRATGQLRISFSRAPPSELRDMAAAFEEAVARLAYHEAKHKVAVARQDMLMQEIHHRVKNNMQIVASLLNLQSSRIRQPEAQAEFAAARDRVRTLATLHRYLYLQTDMNSIAMPDFLAELCSQLFQAMGKVPGQRIQLWIHACQLHMGADQTVPLALIVTEAVSNALKHAFPDDRAGSIIVRLQLNGGMAELEVLDDGIGMAEDKASADTARDGIGITLIRGFARQLGASLQVTTTGGTRYTLRIPLQEIPEPGLA